MLKISPSIRLKYLVTGTGRCGTVFMARLLTSLGEMCGHEAIFSHEGKEKAINRLMRKESVELSNCSRDGDWFIPERLTSESSYMAAPFLDDEILSGSKIIHVVRNPLDVVNSHTQDVHFFEYPNPHQLPWQQFVLTYLPEIPEIDNLLERACFYYIRWNEMIEDRAAGKPYILHRVEEKLSPDLIEFLNITQPESYFDDHRINSWNRREKDFGYSDIPDGEIKSKFLLLAEKYKYK